MEEIEETEGQLTVEDILAEASDHPYHTILEVWDKVLAGANAEAPKPVTPQWAMRIVTKYQGIGFADMDRYRNAYFALVAELRNVLSVEIADDPEALEITSALEDAERNSFHYVNVLIGWQKVMLLRELEWRPSDEDAAIGVAVLSEVHKTVFGPEALTSLLDQINMVFTDEHSELLVSELAALKETVEGR